MLKVFGEMFFNEYYLYKRILFGFFFEFGFSFIGFFWLYFIYFESYEVLELF